jgi:DNA processing protein
MQEEKLEKMAMVAVWAVDGIGCVAYRKIAYFLEQRQLQWSDFWHQHVAILRELSLSENTVESCKKFISEYSYTEYHELLLEKHIRAVLDREPEYPALLCETESRPPVLFVRGNALSAVACPIAVVGTRSMTSYGEMATKKIVSELVYGGASIVSGFMYGIDALAHSTAVHHAGHTVGVLGYGFDTLYPRTQEHLYREVLDAGGCFITEYAPHVTPKPGNFPARNRLVAGMSLGVVVVEAGIKSGSHITARIAGEEGRDVFAVPGSLTNPYSEGTKVLIQQGALLVTSGQEILREVGCLGLGAHIAEGGPVESGIVESGSTRRTFGRETVTYSSPHKTPSEQIIQELAQAPTTITELSTRLDLPITQLQELVTLLELQGAVVKRGGELLLS